MATERPHKATRKKPQTAGRYRIGMVARLTGLSTHTLRAWERRYESVVPGRMAGGARLYDDGDVARLRLLRVLTEEGHAIGSIAPLALDELEQLAGRSDARSTSHAAVFRARFLEAITVFDVATAARLLT